MVVVDRYQGGMGYNFRALTTISQMVTHLSQCSYISEGQADAVLVGIKYSVRALL